MLHRAEEWIVRRVADVAAPENDGHAKTGALRWLERARFRTAKQLYAVLVAGAVIGPPALAHLCRAPVVWPFYVLAACCLVCAALSWVIALAGHRITVHTAYRSGLGEGTALGLFAEAEAVRATAGELLASDPAGRSAPAAAAGSDRPSCPAAPPAPAGAPHFLPPQAPEQ